MRTDPHGNGLQVESLDAFVDEVIEDLDRDFGVEWDAAAPAIAPLTVRDATADVLASLALVPPARAGRHPTPWPPAAWDTPAVVNHHFVASPPVTGSDLNFARMDVNPDMVHRVIEITGITAPQLFAVSWPRTLPRTATSGPTPCLIYFRPTVGQNVARGYYVGRGLGTYPFGWDYLFYGLWRYINYMGDPLTSDPYAKGLPYQVTAAQRNAVLVVPLNRHPGELGVLLDAAWMQRILTEIQTFMFRQAGVRLAPPLGRTALAGFSSGNTLITQFLASAANQRHSFYLDTLRELYMFDIPASGIGGWVSQAVRWARAGSAADKMIRVFTRSNHGSYRTLLGATPPSGAPFVMDSPGDGLRTVAVLPDAAWRRVTTALGAPALVRDWQETHQLISATMLTDALRRSAFSIAV